MLLVHMPTPAPTRATMPDAVTDSFGEDAAAHIPIIRAVIASVLHERRDHPDVEDCVHDVVRRALEGRARLRPNEALRPWLLGIATHGQRKAMLMFHLEGLGYQDIAEQLEVPLGTVATWISRGRRTIATELRLQAREP